MNPVLDTTLIVSLSALLAMASAVAGALWSRVRARPTSRAETLARELAGRIQEVEAVLARLEVVVERAGTLKRKGKPLPAAWLFPGGPAACWRVDPPAESALAEPTLIAVPDLTVSSSEAEDTAAAELNDRYAPIGELADAGAPPEAIARATGQPIGQVELILGLRRQLAQSGPGGRA